METKLLRAYRWSVLLLCGLAGLDALVPGGTSNPTSRAFVGVALAAFAVSFWIATGRVPARRDPRWTVGLLLAQLPACGAVPEGLFVLALEAPLVLARTTLLRWLGLQAVVSVAILGAGAASIFADAPEHRHLSAPVAVVMHALYWVGGQAVTAAAGVLAAQALRSRRELVRLNAELKATQGFLSEGARSAERVRLSREVDEAMGRDLAEMILQLELAAQRARPPADAPLRSAQAASRRLLTDVRDVLGMLRPATGGRHVDLGVALRTLATGIEGLSLHLSSPERIEVDPVAAHAAFRCVQEALTNALRHSGARNVWIDVRRSGAGLEVQVRDDGRGASVAREGNGLRGVRNRVEEAGGTLRIEAARRRGFTVSAVLPLGDEVALSGGEAEVAVPGPVPAER